MPSMWLTKTKAMRAEGPVDRQFSMRELYRAWLMLGGLLKSYKPSTTRCDHCGGDVRKPRTKLNKLVKRLGVEEGRRIWRQQIRPNQGIQIETFVGDHKLVHVVCSEKCLNKSRQSNKETEECLLMLREGKMQVRALQKFLKSGRLDALRTLPPELGPEPSSRAS